MTNRQSLALVLAAVLAGLLVRAIAEDEAAGVADHAEHAAAKATTTAATATAETALIAVAPPPLSEDYFPCSTCHEGEEVNRTRRKLVEEHTDIVLNHGPAESRWCLDCHDAENRDKLHLTNGTLIDFTESYKLCGQCHGPKLRDWKVGVHGKRTGSWSGTKEYLLCAHCHSPHSPGFKPLKPLPPPVTPADLRD